MPSVNLSVLNQRQTPALYADTFANIPPAGYNGRIFWSTDTFAIYRDNGTGWDLFGGPGTGTVTGTGTTGQIAIWNGATVIGGTNTTGSGSVVLSNSPALTLPSFTSVNVVGGIAAMPTGSGTLLYSSALGAYLPLIAGSGNPITGDLYINQNSEYLRSTAQSVGLTQVQSWYNSNGTRRGFFGYGSVSSDTLMLQNESGGDISSIISGVEKLVINTAYIKALTRLNVNGATDNISYALNVTGAGLFSSSVEATSIIKTGSSNSFFLLGGGGTVATSSFAPATGGSYLPLAGGNLTGVVNSTTRLNLGGATDNSSRQLNVTGIGYISQYLGIGIDASFPLDLVGENGTTVVSGITYNNIVRFRGSTVGGILFVGQPTFLHQQICTTNNSADLSLACRNGGTNNEYLRLVAAGRVLIGATLPTDDATSALQVNGNIRAAARINGNGATDNSIYQINTLGTINSNGLSFTGSTVSTNQTLSTNTVFVFNGGAGITWTLENPSGNNRIIYVKNFGSANLTVAAFSGTNIVDAGGALQTSVTVNVGKTKVFWQDGNVKSYELSN